MLRVIGEKFFAPLMERPEARALWWPRFRRIADWFADWETARRESIEKIDAEIRGEIQLPLDNERIFTLSARADRIEQRHDGSFAILDYKTGQVPTEKQVRVGISPQLTLEAAILRQSGFKDLAPASVTELVYVSLKGAAIAGDAITINFEEGDADSHADNALTKLRGVATRFEDPAQPYRPLVLSMWKTRYGTYDHLARVKEWSVMGEDEAGFPYVRGGG
jgi:ATP-dependent helicase/nuclease subunit B